MELWTCETWNMEWNGRNVECWKGGKVNHGEIVGVYVSTGTVEKVRRCTCETWKVGTVDTWKGGLVNGGVDKWKRWKRGTVER